MEKILSFITFITRSDILEIALQIIGGFSMIATLTKNTADNKILNMILKIINLIGGNFGKAANKDD